MTIDEAEELIEVVGSITRDCVTNAIESDYETNLRRTNSFRLHERWSETTIRQLRQVDSI